MGLFGRTHTRLLTWSPAVGARARTGETVTLESWENDSLFHIPSQSLSTGMSKETELLNASKLLECGSQGGLLIIVQLG